MPEIFWVFRVCFATHFSSPVMLRCGIPQESVLGPLFFIIYTAELEDVMKRHGCIALQYVCCWQSCLCALPSLWIHGGSSQAWRLGWKREGCVKNMGSWMVSNWLKLSPSKTGLMWFSTKHGLEKLLPATVNINSIVINTVKLAKTLGVTLDDEFKLVKHVATVCHLSYYQIRQLKLLTWLQHWYISSPLELITAVVCSYPHQHIKCNNYNECWIPRRARSFTFQDFDLDFRIRVKDKLHWLHVREGVMYKLCTPVYKSLHGLASGYLTEICIPDSYHRNLRSEDKNKLQVPWHNFRYTGCDHSALQVKGLGTLSHNI